MLKLGLFVIQKLMGVYGTLSNENLEKNIFEDLDYLENLLDEDSQDAISALFDLEDENFQQIFPSFLDVFKENIDKPEFEILAKEILKEDFLNEKEIKKTMEDIDKEIKEYPNLSEVKKQGLSFFFSLLLNKYIEILEKKERIIIPIEKEKDEIKLPIYARPGDAGMDLYAKEDYTIGPGETIVIPTGLKMAIPEGFCILIHPRSGISAKTGLRFANSIGLIDSQYKGDISVIIENKEPKIEDIDYDFDENGNITIKSILHGKTYTISKGDRFAQIRLAKVPQIIFKEVDSVEGIGGNRGGGLGSTGIK